MNNGFSHLDNRGNARVVDISKKKKSLRYARAQATVWLSKKILEMIKNDEFKKGNVINVARIAGIMGAKRTSSLIPLCHNIPIDSVNVEITKKAKMNSLKVYAKVQTSSKTGVEMEALTAVTVSCLTIYDMCKYLNKSIKIKNIKLVSKKGGKSANFRV